MADAAVEDLYRTVFADRTVTPDENAEIATALRGLEAVADGATSPPAVTPDKLVWLRAAAFRVGCEFLADGDGDAGDPRAENVKLLRAINAVVNALETTCLLPALGEESGPEFSEDRVEELCGQLYEKGDGEEEVIITSDEASALHSFLTAEATRPPLSSLIWLR